MTPQIQSKLPKVGTTIFTVMSGLAAHYQAVNLSQGFPDFACSPELLELVAQALRNGQNQYAPMIGVGVLREQIAIKTQKLYHKTVNPDTEITVTSGATEALFAAIAAVVRQDDEVIIFEPAYDSYLPAIELNGGKAVPISLKAEDYSIDWQAVKKRVNHRTKLIIINSPHNPTGSILQATDIDELTRLVRDTNILLIGDEVYEHIIFDNQTHQSLLLYEELATRSFVISSFGKTFHVTGWKIGYCIAPPTLTTEFRKVHQYLTFSSATPLQYAIAAYLQNPEHYVNLSAFYEKKRNQFVELIKETRFKILPTAGTYFQLLDYESITQEDDTDFAIRLTKEFGVAAIPISVFYSQDDEAKHRKVLRFCFAKTDETLALAAERLQKV